MSPVFYLIRACILAALMMGAQPQALAAETVSIAFEDLPALVRERNKLLQADKASYEAAHAQTGHLTRSFLPEIRGEAGGEVFQTGTLGRRTEPVGSVEGRVNLFRGGRDYLEEGIRKTKRDLAAAHLRQRGTEVLGRARHLYADAVYFRESLRNVKDASSALSGHSGAVKKQVESGVAPESERLDSSMLQNRLERSAILYEEDYEHSIEELKALLGFSHDTRLKLSDPARGTPKSGEATRLLKGSFDVEHHPEIRLLKKKQSLTELQKKEAGRWWVPSVEAYGGYALYPFREREYAALKDRDESVGGLKVSAEIFDGLHSRAKEKALGFQAKSLSLEAQQKGLELQALQEKLRHELKSRIKLMGLLEQNLKTGREYMRLSQEEYERGLKSGSQWMEALQGYFGERQSLAETRREYYRILADLSALLGDAP